MIPYRLTATVRRLFAPDCCVCGVEAGDPVCAGCRADYFAADAPRCRCCANRLPAPSTLGRAFDLCGRCLAHAPRFDATVALADYAPPVDAMVGALKFHARLDLGWAFGTLLAMRIATLGADAVVPLPLAPARLRERGYNQSEEIARALAARLRRPLLRHALLRPLHRPSQQGLTLARRRTNVRGAFAAGPQAPQHVAGLHIVLVDDVLTTGSTLDEAAAVLKRAGARRISNAVVARTP